MMNHSISNKINVIMKRGGRGLQISSGLLFDFCVLLTLLAGFFSRKIQPETTA